MKLEVLNLNFSYKNDNLILKDVNFEAKKGDIISIKGVNGSGKTTFLKLLTGILTPKSGSISFKDNNPKTKIYKNSMAYFRSNLIFLKC